MTISKEDVSHHYVEQITCWIFSIYASWFLRDFREMMNEVTQNGTQLDSSNLVMIFLSKMWMKEITGVWEFSLKKKQVYIYIYIYIYMCIYLYKFFHWDRMWWNFMRFTKATVFSFYHHSVATCRVEKCHRFDDFVVLYVSCQNCSCTSWRLHFEFRIERNRFWIAVSMTCSLRILLISLWSFEKKMWEVTHDNWSTALFFLNHDASFCYMVAYSKLSMFFLHRQSRNFCDDDYCQTRESNLRFFKFEKSHKIYCSCNLEWHTPRKIMMYFFCVIDLCSNRSY